MAGQSSTHRLEIHPDTAIKRFQSWAAGNRCPVLVHQAVQRGADRSNTSASRVSSPTARPQVG